MQGHPPRAVIVMLASVVLAAAIVTGCSTVRSNDDASSDGGNASTRTTAEGSEVSRTASTVPEHQAHAYDDTLERLLSAATLDRTALIAAVLARNPSIAAAREGWRAAKARTPQQSAWEDPMLSYRFAPLSIAVSDLPYGQDIELSQRLSIGGKTDLLGAIAAAEADVARADYHAARLRLGLMASQMYDAYALAVRALEITERHRALVADLKHSAEAHVAAGTASVQDPLQAEAEAIELEQQQIAFTADHDVAIAQLNGLLHRMPREALPVPPDETPLVASPDGDSAQLQDEAIRSRPEIHQVNAKDQAARSSLAFAQSQYLPDVSVSGSYSSMWGENEYRYGLGISVSLPVHRDRLQGGVDEAEARIAQTQKDREHMERDMRVAVEEAHRRLAAAQKTALLIHDRLIPTTEQRLMAARIGFEAGRDSFSAVIAAERAVRGVALRAAEARADVSRRTATLLNAIGRIPTSLTAGETP